MERSRGVMGHASTAGCASVISARRELEQLDHTRDITGSVSKVEID